MECGVCFEGYNEHQRRPLALPCGHTFCKACVFSLQQQRCPECKCSLNGRRHNLPTNIAVLRAVTAAAVVEPHSSGPAVAPHSSLTAQLSLQPPVSARWAASLPSYPAASEDPHGTASAPAQAPEQGRPGRRGVLGLLQRVMRPQHSSGSSTAARARAAAINSNPLWQGMFLSEWMAMLLNSPLGSEDQVMAAGALLTFVQQPPGGLQLLAAGGIPVCAALLRQLADSSTDGGSSSGGGHPSSSSSSSSSSPGAVSTAAVRQPAGCEEACSALQRTAATALQRMMQEQPACCWDVVAAGAVPALAALLRQPANELTQQAAAAALETLCSPACDADGACRAAVAQAGAIVPAVRLLLSSNPAIQVSAAAMLTHLTAGSEACRAEALEAGAIPAALRSLRSTPAGPPFAVVQEQALAFLTVAASAAAGAAAVRRAGGVLQLVRLLRSPSSAVRANAAQAVHILADSDSQACSEIETAGGLTALVQLLGSCSSNSNMLSHAAGALWVCMAGSSGRAAAACCAGAVPVLAELLRDDSDDVRYLAAAALKEACMADEAACVQLRESDGIEQLVSFLMSELASDRLIRVTAAVLAAVGRKDKESRVAMKRAGACFALQLLASHCEDHWAFEDPDLSSHIAEALWYVDGSSAPLISKDSRR